MFVFQKDLNISRDFTIFMPDVSMQGNLEINKKEGFVMVSVNPKIYPLDVVLSSSYMFTDKNYVLVDGDPEEELIVELRPKDKNADIEKLGRDFNNELINYANYAVRAIQNQGMREAIIHRVLMTNSAGRPDYRQPVEEYPAADEELLEVDAKPWIKSDEKSEADSPWFDDPEGIAVPWEEKYGDKGKKK